MWTARVIAGYLLLSLAPLFASGDRVPPPKWEDEAITVSPTVARDLVQEFRLGEYVARFEETSLHEIQRELGAGSLEREGDAGGYVAWLSYSLPSQLIWLVSTEMGGTDEKLMEIFAESVSPSDSRPRLCSPIPSAFRPLSLQFGWIGSSASALKKSLGKPSGVRGDWLLYYFSEVRPCQCPGDSVPDADSCDVTAYVEVRVKQGKVAAIRASHVTSY